MMVLIANGWGGVGKGMDLIIQKQRADTETKRMALMVIGNIIIITWFSGWWLAVHQTTRVLKKILGQFFCLEDKQGLL